MLSGGDPEACRSVDRRKEVNFRAFVTAKGAEQPDHGLSEQLLRQSLRASFVVRDLPRALVAQLVYSHGVQLTGFEEARRARCWPRPLAGRRPHAGRPAR